jgi:hypothetical protein
MKTPKKAPKKSLKPKPKKTAPAPNRAQKKKIKATIKSGAGTWDNPYIITYSKKDIEDLRANVAAYSEHLLAQRTLIGRIRHTIKRIKERILS